tara:strand:- start:6273 stop:7964 length:1692 start_codon:yes stop_codon:yes gene_type:complete
MKTHIKNNTKPFVSLNLSKKQSVYISMLLSLAILNLSISCSYYTVRNVPTTKENVSKQIKEFNQSEKYVIIHSDSLYWHLSEVVINEDTQTLSGTIRPITSEHQYKKSRESKRVHRYNHTKKDPLNEIHFNLKTATNFELNQTANIPLENIASISVNDKNTGRAIANVLLGTVGIVFVALLLVAALKSSCPFVYIKNGKEFDFVGELYPGTITANMQKDDYLPLPHVEAEKDTYTVKIANYLKEIQYTDYVQLVMFNHDANLEVLLDSKGELQTFKNIIKPKNVVFDDDSKNIEPALKKDNNFYTFDTAVKTNNSSRYITFEFDKPNNAEKAKLYLTAKNSVWLDYIFGKFNEQFGMYYNTFQKEQQEVSRDSIKGWTEGQNIPLSVYLKTNKGWKLVEKINTVGPMAMRDLVVPLELKGINKDKIQIKLETGFMFWEVDYVGMDFSKNIDLKPEYISPSKAVDQVGNNVTESLLNQDNNYLIQPNIGDEVTVSFSVEKPKPELVQSVFLKNRGYYNYIRDYKGIPDFEKLKSFRIDNTFTKYSEKVYFDFVNFDLNTLAYHE